MEKKEDKLQELAMNILEVAGGQENISQVSHCYTRFRFTAKDISRINEDELKAIDGVLGVVVKGTEYQVVVGPEAENLYHRFIKLGEFETAGNVENVQDRNKPKGFVKLLNFVGEIFTPLIPILIVGGIIGPVLAILTNFFGVTADSGTYIVFDALSRAAFYFIPIYVGFSAAKKMNINQYLGGMLGALLLFSTINAAEGLTLLRINIPTVTYNNTVFPVLLGVGFMYPIYKFFDRHLPNAIKMIFLPLLTMIIVVPVTLIVLGPICNIVGDWLSDVIYSLYKTVPSIAVMLIGLLSPLLMLFGMHYALYPIVITMFDTIGYDPLVMAGLLSANVAVGAACLAVGIKSGNETTRGVGIATGVSGLCGIAEPGLYSILVPMRTPLIGAMIGGGLAGLLAGLIGVTGYSVAAPSFVTLYYFDSHNGSLIGLNQALIVAVVSLVITFATTWVLYKDKKE